MTELEPEISVTDVIGRSFGPYTLSRRLGVGGMAETFEAVRRGRSGFEQRVCLKLVRPDFQDNVDTISLFEREARLAARLHHSCIVGVIDFGEIDGILFMALELVDGSDLQGIIDQRSRLSPEHVALIGHDLATALAHAHEPHGEEDGAVGIIHRDVSPSNVMISRHGEVKLTDFGLASFAASGSRQSEVRGKFPYMAPERLRAEAVDGRTDLFSLGVVLFEALAGRRPFDGGNDPATIMLIVEGEHAPLAELAPSAPPELCALIEGLIHREPDERPATAAGFATQLDRLVPAPSARRKLGKYALDARERRSAERPISSRRLSESELPGRAAPSRPPSKSQLLTRRKVAVGAGAVSVVALGTLAWSWRGVSTPPDETGSEESPPAQPAAEPSVSVVPVPPEASSREAATSQEPSVEPPQPAPKPRQPARLTVFVAPWGDVWVDGKARGTAPVRALKLRPGLHRVSAGQGTPSKSRNVRLRGGQRLTVRFDLSD